MNNKTRTNIITGVLLILSLIFCLDEFRIKNELTNETKEYQTLKNANKDSSRKLDLLMEVPDPTDRKPVQLINLVAKEAYSWHNQRDYLENKQKIQKILNSSDDLNELMPSDEDTAGQSMINNLNLHSKVTNVFIYKLPESNDSNNKKEYGVVISYLATTPTSVNALSKSTLTRSTEYKFEINSKEKMVESIERVQGFREVLNKGKVN